MSGYHFVTHMKYKELFKNMYNNVVKSKCINFVIVVAFLHRKLLIVGNVYELSLSHLTY